MSPSRGPLANALIPLIEARFAGLRPARHEDAAPFMTFQPVWPGFGVLEIHDDDHEVTIVFGNFTHVHVSEFDDEMSSAQKVESICRQTIEWLENTFADRVEFWRSGWGGGCRVHPERIERAKLPVGAVASAYAVWSGPGADRAGKQPA